MEKQKHENIPKFISQYQFDEMVKKIVRAPKRKDSEVEESGNTKADDLESDSSKS